jgi:hemerythrin
MSDALQWDDTRHCLDHGDMDHAHKEFIRLLNQAANAGKGEFTASFLQLQTHTQQHFAVEERLMDASGFPASAEHKAEHQRILGELHQLAIRVQQGRAMMARAYVQDKLPEWFNLHTATMDSALAAHCNAG